MFARVLLVASINLLFLAQAKSDVVTDNNSVASEDAIKSVTADDFRNVVLVANLVPVEDTRSISGGLESDTAPPHERMACTTLTYGGDSTAWPPRIDLGRVGAESGLDIEVASSSVTASTQKQLDLDKSGREFASIVTVPKPLVAALVFMASAVLLFRRRRPTIC